MDSGLYWIGPGMVLGLGYISSVDPVVLVVSTKGPNVYFLKM